MKNRIRLMLRAVVPVALLWVPLVLFAELFGATWPDSSVAWQNLVVFALIVSFLLIKSILMLRRMPYIDWLTVSLVAANGAFIALYLTVIGFGLWPDFRVDYPHAYLRILQGLRVVLVVVLMAGIWMLVNVPEPIYDEDGANA